MKMGFSIMFFLLSCGLYSQQYYCATEPIDQESTGDLQKYIGTRSITYINVVVHLLYTNSTDSISDEQIHSQIEVLNEDFGKTNSNFNETPEIFKQVAADTELRFCLAHVDPEGSPTTGITRSKTNVSNIGATESYYSTMKGGIDAWDPSRYINIWVADNGGTQIIGKATFPGQADPPEKDGVVMNYRYFGREGLAKDFPPHDLGRGCVHEMGHYFGLEHIFGSIGSECADDDGFTDTPLQDQPTIGCPSFPKPDICTQADGIMFMNFMDYTDDACMTMFTAQQKDKIWSVLNNERQGLLENTSDQCIVPTDEEELDEIWTFYPNPVSSGVFILKDQNWSTASTVSFYSVESKKIFWTEVPSSNYSIDITSLQAGIYWISYKGSIRKLIKM